MSTYLISRPLQPFSMRSRSVKKLPSDFDIFSPFTLKWAQCIHVLTNSQPVAASA